MLIVGLTGSIGMGKSTVAAYLRTKGIAVLDADAEVHRLYAGPAVPLIEAAFPGSTGPAGVDRLHLAAAIKVDPTALPRLEAIVHPLVREVERKFLLAEAERGAAMAVLEIPLLLETGGEAGVDVVIVVSAPAEAQRLRVLQRPGMTAERLDALLARQMPDHHKRARAHFVVDTGGSLRDTEAQLDAIIESLAGRQGRALAHWSR